jgi:two-component system sensor histidine kinase BaeS
MRSISIKLILSFVCVSLVAILLIVVFDRYNTTQEFKRFSSTSNESSLTAALQQYYETNGSWAGIDNAQLFRPVQFPPADNPPAPRDPLTVTDVNGQVLRAGLNYALGSKVPVDVLARGKPIQINGQTVGYMIFEPSPFGENSPEQAFLVRINQLLIYTAVGTLLISLLLGVLLSRTLTRPIRELTNATQAVAAGDLTRQVPVRSRDELGKLADSFNRMSAELARSLNLRRQMTADIAHELRTPISIIMGHAEAVHDGVLPPTLENFEIVRDEAGRLDKLIEDLRTLSRADAGELPMERQPVAPGKLLARVRAIHLHRAQQRKIALKTEIAPNLPPASMDPDRMMQVLSNLLDNALRYSPEGSEIILSVHAVEDMLEIGVQDSGPGVAPDELECIFDRFYRSDSSRQRDESGSGLGLAIARSIVEKHGGRIWAESAGENGLKILIRLPKGN